MDRETELSQAMRNVHAGALALLREDTDALKALIEALGQEPRRHWLSAFGIIAMLAELVAEREGRSAEAVLRDFALLQAADEAGMLDQEPPEDSGS